MYKAILIESQTKYKNLWSNNLINILQTHKGRLTQRKNNICYNKTKIKTLVEIEDLFILYAHFLCYFWNI